MQGGQYKKNTRIDRRVAVITGANSGIGKETAIDLARRGGKVYIACRDVRRGEDALREIKEKSGSDDVHFLQLDLASLESVRTFARKFRELESRLHILINNAGIMACPKGFTKDGIEMQLATNHLGHFLLTNLLLDLLKAGAPSRVVIVSSVLHRIGYIKKDDLNSEKSYRKWLVYGQSKLANILFTRELSKRLEGTGVTANCLHPGKFRLMLKFWSLPRFTFRCDQHGAVPEPRLMLKVSNSDLSSGINCRINASRKISKNPHLSPSRLTDRLLFNPAKRLVFKSIKAGAQTSIRLAVDPDLETVSGKYFADCEPVTPSAAARDDETAAWLWKASENLTHLASV